MPPVTAAIVGATPKAQANAKNLMELSNNNFIFTADANLRHTPAFYVGIFNVSDLEQRIERPWVHHTKQGKVILVPGCEPGEKLSKPFIIPDIVQMPIERPGSWELNTRGVPGQFLAQDAINPEDPSGSWRTVRKAGAGNAMNEGTNLYRFGCFWITAASIADLVAGRADGMEEALTLANTRLEETYNTLISEADLLALQGVQGLQQIGNLHRRAANALGLTRDWNQRFAKKIACPGCGDPINPTAARHFSQQGGCGSVINWEKALAVGVATVQEAVAAGVIEPQATAMAEEAPKRKAKS